MEFSTRFPSDHKHDYEEIEIFAIEEQDGVSYYDTIYVMERGGKTYWICQKLFLEGDEVVDRGEIAVFEAMEIEGEDHVKPLEDEELLKEILTEFESILEDVDRNNEEIK